MAPMRDGREITERSCTVHMSEANMDQRMVTDTDRINWMEQMMTPKDDYCEIFFAGLRDGDADASAFQVEANPERFKVLNAPTLRDAIDKAMKASCR